MRELLYNAAKHYKRGRALAERGDVRGAMAAYGDAILDLHAVKPQRMRNVLLAQAYLSRYQTGMDLDPEAAESDLRMGYSYARTTQEPTVRHLAEELWRAHAEGEPVRAVTAVGAARGGDGDGPSAAAPGDDAATPRDGHPEGAQDERAVDERVSEDLPIP